MQDLCMLTFREDSKILHHPRRETSYLSANQAKLVTPSNDGGEGDGTKQPTEQSQPESSNPNPTTTEPPTEPHQQRRRLEGEIKRLQTMISDKQTLQDGRIVDLNRKLQEATSRCRRLKHTRNESEKRLLYALVENERLRFLLKTQASTITTLKSDFSVIENLTHQQIDLLPDRNTRSPLSNAARHSTSATRGEEHDNKASTNPISSTIIDNHHCNYRHPSGSAAIPSSSPSSSPSCTRLTSAVTSDDDCYLGGSSRNQLLPFPSPGMQQQQQSSNADTTTSTQENPDACMVAAVAAEKLRKLRRHYGFKISLKKKVTTTTKTLDDNILNAAAGAAVLRCKPPPPPLGCKRGAGTREKGAKNGSHFKSAPPKSSAAPPPPEKLKSSKSMPSMQFSWRNQTATNTPYDGPYRVLRRKKKVFVIDNKGRKQAISVDRLKAAHIQTTELPRQPTDATRDNASPSNSRDVAEPPPYKTKSGRHVRIPRRVW
nr:uncharacterized protein LOC115263505 [Aedes albopictus]